MVEKNGVKISVLEKFIEKQKAISSFNEQIAIMIANNFSPSKFGFDKSSD